MSMNCDDNVDKMEVSTCKTNVKDPKKNDHNRQDKHDKQYDKYNPWIWVDIESSGLDPDTSNILEISAIITNSDMEIWDSIHIVIHHPHAILLANSSSWCKRKFCSASFGGNGLFDACHYSNTSHQEASYMLYNFFEFYSSHGVGRGRPEIRNRMFFDRTMDSKGEYMGKFDVSQASYASKSPHRLIMLAGSTVHFDRGFLLRHFPSLKKFLNHKVIDVTSLLETCRRFRPDVLVDLPRPSGHHRARQDIIDSINLYSYIKAHVFDKA